MICLNLFTFLFYFILCLLGVCIHHRSLEFYDGESVMMEENEDIAYCSIDICDNISTNKDEAEYNDINTSHNLCLEIMSMNESIAVFNTTEKFKLIGNECNNNTPAITTTPPHQGKQLFRFLSDRTISITLSNNYNAEILNTEENNNASNKYIQLCATSTYESLL